MTARKLVTASAIAGFTIIEVMIVLAIAALIMLIVFLAVPALQRNSRNTQYRSEADRLLAASAEYMASSGVAPTCVTFPCNSGTAGTNPNSIAALAGSLKSITTLNMPQAAGNLTALTPTLSTAQLESGVKCGATGGATVTPTAAAPKSLILVFATEDSAGNVVAQCVAG